MAKEASKKKIERIFSERLREIAQEITEFIDVPDENGKHCKDGVVYDLKVVSKAEALARYLWKIALGYTEEVGEGKEQKVIVHGPNKWAIGLLFDRLEGKTTIVPVEKGTRPSLADRISDTGVDSLNKIADDTAD